MSITKKEQLAEAVHLSFNREVIKKLVFSRPRGTEVQRVSGRLVAHRGQRMLVLEYSLRDNTVSHRNIREDALRQTVLELADEYSQINLITTAGECEWKISKGGKEALLGTERLKSRLAGESTAFESAIGSLDNKKKHILSGDEDFLKALGISDKNGRVHDKKQGKFRQINRFLEIIEDSSDSLPQEGTLTVYDLCCGKSYLSFAVYYYLTVKMGREVEMLGMDLKHDCIEWCASLAGALGYSGMHFICDDIRKTPDGKVPDMVISLHACDIATDIVLSRAAELGTGMILSTPCCHRHINDLIQSKELEFVTKHPHLRNKLCDALTDALRVARLESEGYSVTVIELVDPDDTPKNTLIKAIKRPYGEVQTDTKKAEYNACKEFLFGDRSSEYLKGVIK